MLALVQIQATEILLFFQFHIYGPFDLQKGKVTNNTQDEHLKYETTFCLMRCLVDNK